MINGLSTISSVFRVISGVITTKISTWILHLQNHLYFTTTKYIYIAASSTADNVGDFREYVLGGWKYIECCTVANAAKDGGTWVKSKAVATITLVDNNMQYTDDIPQTAGAFITMDTFSKTSGKINGINTTNIYAYFTLSDNPVDGFLLLQNSADCSKVEENDKLVFWTNSTPSWFIINELGSTINFTIEVNFSQ